MGVKLNLVLLLVAGVVCVVLQASALPANKQEGLVRLGTSMNVTYFAGREELNWEQGRQLCRSMNLTLAEVHYPEQEEFLKEALTTLNEASHYHTAGRTRVGLDSLVWDSTNSDVDALSAVQLNTRPQLCLLIRVPDYETLWETDPCTDNWPPICQST